ncbi:hypothetical protein ACLKA7_004256 [Drosophila subpalustris]
MKQVRLPEILTTERDTTISPNWKVEVVVFGTASMEYTTYLNELPKPGETKKAMYREECFGGRAANQCVAAAKLGAHCALVSKLGSDDLGRTYYEYLQQMDINMDYVQMVEGQQTGTCHISVDDNSQSSIVVLPGANATLSHKDVSRSRKAFNQAKVLLCQLDTEPKVVLCALKQFKGVSILNGAPGMKTLSPELIKAPTILCINEVEAALLTERKEIRFVQDAKEAAHELLLKGAKTVIITMGDQGAVFLSSSEPDTCLHCPAAPVRYLADTSGAGDAFLGSLAFHIVHFPKLNLEHHIHAANLCAAYAVGKRGTQPSFPGPEMAQDDLCLIDPAFYIILNETKEQKAWRERQAGVVPAPVESKPELTPEPQPEPKPETKTETTSESKSALKKESEDEDEPKRLKPPTPSLVPTVVPSQALAPEPNQAPTPIPYEVAPEEKKETATVMPAARAAAQRATEVAAAVVSSRATQRTTDVPASVVPARVTQKARKVNHNKKRPIHKSHAH